MKYFGYPTREKLKNKTEISLLFNKGKWRTSGNLRVISYRMDELANQKVGVSVSKRNFKKAVDRNRIKRLLREAYRLNKETFTQTFGTNSLSMIFWISKDLPNHYKEVENELLRLCESKK